jgi:predicted alpha/beta hydrolase family esterase
VKRVFIVHGWEGFPEEGWFPWLKTELEKKGIITQVLKMPDSAHPKIRPWTSYLATKVKNVDTETYFVGHSIGCQTILRYLEKSKGNTGGCVFVAGWFTLSSAATTTREGKTIAKPWLSTPIDCVTVRKKMKQAIAVFSDNDPYVPLHNAEMFKVELGSRIIILKNKKHFTGEDGITKLPVVLSSLDAMMK